MAEIDAFFKLMHEQGASYLHLASGQQPAIRLHGDIERIKYDVLSNCSYALSYADQNLSSPC